MKLAQYLKLRQMTPIEFSRKLNLGSRTTVHRWISGERIPAREMMAKIIRATSGAVQPNDFYDPGGPREQHPWTQVRPAQRVSLRDLAIQGMMKSGDLTAPAAYALLTLRHRASYLGEGAFTLDGRPADVRRIITAANELLGSKRLPCIFYPGVSQTSATGWVDLSGIS